MSDKAFLDTNVIIYLYSETETFKRSAACNALNVYDCITSIQALNESSNVWLRKYGWDSIKIKEHLDNIELICNEIIPIRKDTIIHALVLKEKYNYSYYDCLMLASALECSCTTLLTEDMSHGQLVNDKLKIINPFNAM